MPYRCPFCGMLLHFKSGFALHVRMHLDGERRCPACGKRFASWRSLAQHVAQLGLVDPRHAAVYVATSRRGGCRTRLARKKRAWALVVAR